MAQNTNKMLQSSAEELDSLHKKVSLLAFRGQSSECARFIEENLSKLYKAERWPENFLSTLLVHKKCYSALGKSAPWEEYTAKLLKKAAIPAIFVELARSGGRDAVWRSEVMREKALSLRAAAQYERALDYADLCIKTEPHSSNAYLVKGWILEDKREFENAIAMYEQALVLSASNIQARQGIARTMAAISPKKAFTYLQEIIEDSPDIAEFREEKARIYFALGQRDRAMEEWDEAITIDPYNAVYPYEKAELLLAEGKEAAAIAQYRRAIGLNSRHLPSLKRLVALLAKTSPSSALELAQTAVSLDQDDIETGLLCATLLLKMGDSSAAEQHYQRLLLLDENDHRILAGIAQVYRRSKPESALEYYNRALGLAPSKAEYHIGSAEAFDALEREDEAVASYRAALRLDPNNAAVLGTLGILLGKSNPHEALSLFEKAISLKPECLDYYNGKAAILEQMPDKKNQMLETLEIACRLDPGNAGLHERIGLILEREGNRASSVRHFEEAVSLDPKQAEPFAGIARQLAETRPHIALDAINSAIDLSFSGGIYYYWKALILRRIANDTYALMRVKPRKNIYGQALNDELDLLRDGSAMQLALHYANRAVALLPQNNDCLCLLAALLASLGREAESLRRYEELLKTDSANCEALYGLASLQEQCREYTMALEKLEQAIQLSPKTARYRAAKARILAKMGRTADAAAEYEIAIPLDTWAWEPVLELALLKEKEGEIFAAMASYRRCLLIHRDCLVATEHMGRLLCPLNPFAAIAYINHSIKLDKKNWLNHAWLGCALYGASRPEEAEAALALAVEDNAENYYIIAGILCENAPEQAMQYCELAIKAEPQRTESYLLLGDIQMKLDNHDEALIAYSRAAEIDPREHLACLRLAHILFLKRDPACVAMADKAARMAPNDIDTLILRINVMQEFSGDIASALSTVKSALKLAPQNIELHELFAELLWKKKSFVQFAIEKSKLKKLLQHRRDEIEAACKAAEIEFDEEDEQV